MPSIYRKTGVFCLEGQWGNLSDRRTLRPLLEVISGQTDGRVKTLHREAATREEFNHYLKIWLQKQNSAYRVLWLGFHGEEGKLAIGSKDSYELSDLSREIAGKARGRIIYFGSCSTLAVHGKRLNTFVAETGVDGVIGYTEDVDWLESAAFELLLIDALSRYARPKAAFEYLKREHRGLAKRLGLRFVGRSTT